MSELPFSQGTKFPARYSRLLISSSLLPTLSLKELVFRWLQAGSPGASNEISAVPTVERPKNETGSESGTGEGDVSGRWIRAAISVYGALGREQFKGLSLLGMTKKACRNDTGTMKSRALATVCSPLKCLWPVEH